MNGRASAYEGTWQGPSEDGRVREKPSEEVTKQLRPEGKGDAECQGGVWGGKGFAGRSPASGLSLRNGRLSRAF